MSNQILISSGAKLRDLDDVIIGTDGVLSSLGFDVPYGIPRLDSNGKILASELPNSVMEFKGVWNAATNTPYLHDGTGNAGDVWLCNVAGTVDFGAGPIVFAVGDYAVYTGTVWARSSGATGTVTSVAVSRDGNALAITGSPITTAGTINLGFTGSSLQYINGAGNLVTFPTSIAQAQRLVTEVYNETGATLPKGSIVYINGGHGNLPTVTLAQANNEANSSQTYGVIQTDLTNMNNGFAVVIGSLADLDTQTYTAGTILYLSPTVAGAWTSTKPSAPNHMVYVGVVVRSHPTQGVVEVKIQNGYELQELHNVLITSPANNDGLFYDSATSLWENKTIASVLGFTPISLTSLSATSPLSYNNTTGVFSISQATTSTNGYLSSTDWNTFNNKQAQINGTGFVKASGTTISYDNSTYLTTSSAASTYVPYTGATTNVFLGSYGLFSGGVQVINGGSGVISTDGFLWAGKGIFLTDTVSGGTWSSGITNIVARNSGLLITHNLGGGVLAFNTLTTYTYLFPNANGTIALTSDIPSLSGYVQGTGTTNYLPKFTGTSTIGNTSIYEGSAGFVSIGNTNSTYNLDVTGTGRFSGALSGTSATFSGRISVNGAASSTNALEVLGIVNNWGLSVTANTTTGQSYGGIIRGGTNSSDVAFAVNNAANNIGYFVVRGDGAATFSSTLAVGTTISAQNGGTYNGSVEMAGILRIQGSGGHYFTSGNGLEMSYNSIYSYNRGTGAYNDLNINDAMTVKGAGNVGIGGTVPNTWNSIFKVLEIGTLNSSLYGRTDGYDQIFLGTNHYYSTGGSYLYSNSGKPAQRFYEYNGDFVFQNAASGTAGAAITWATPMTLTAGGNLLLGTTTDGGAKLQVVGGSTSISSGLYVGSNTNPGSNIYFSGGVISNNAGTYPLKWNSSTGQVSYDGSSRLGKKDIIDSSYGLAEILKLISRKYYRIDDNREEIGLIADEVLDVMPEFVPMVQKSLFTKNPNDTEIIPGGVNYDKLTSVLIKAVQEQQAQIKELKQEIETLKIK